MAFDIYIPHEAPEPAAIYAQEFVPILRPEVRFVCEQTRPRVLELLAQDPNRLAALGIFQGNERTGRLLEVFHRSQLLTQPSSQNPDEWQAYQARLDALLATPEADIIYKNLQQGLVIRMAFSHGGGTILVAFSTPDDPNTLYTQNFNFDTDTYSSASISNSPESSLEALSRIEILKQQLQQFHSHVEQIIGQSLPREFTDAYLAFQRVFLEEQEQWPIPVVTGEMVRQAASEYSRSIHESLFQDLAFSKRLPRAQQFAALYHESKQLFGTDLLEFGDLAHHLLRQAHTTYETSLEDRQLFGTATEDFRSGMPDVMFDAPDADSVENEPSEPESELDESGSETD